MQAVNVGFHAFKRVFDDPAKAYNGESVSRNGYYDLCWDYYTNRVFDVISRWDSYRSRYQLYRFIRPIYNPVNRLVSFYDSNVYPGVLSEDASKLPKGMQVAIPFPDDTDERLVFGASQLFNWSNWQAGKSILVRYGAVCGNTLIEIVDDTEKGKVYFNNVWAGFVKEIKLDNVGNVKSYILEYESYDEETKKPFVFTKSVTRDGFTISRDQNLIQEVENSYGFVPAVWIKHNDNGGTYGPSLFNHAIPKIDELNSLAAHLHDQLHKVVGAPHIFWTDGDPKPMFGPKDRTVTSTNPNERDSVMLIKAPPGGRVDRLVGDLDFRGALDVIKKQTEEIEADFPELTLYPKMREMVQLNGDAADRVLGDVKKRLLGASAFYDIGTIKAIQMGLAIGGMRYAEGKEGWTKRNRHQQKFAPFGMESYEAGNLDLTLLPRELIPITEKERAEERKLYWEGIEVAQRVGASPEFLLRQDGWTEEDLAQFGAAQVSKIQQEQMLAMEDVVPELPEGVEQ